MAVAMIFATVEYLSSNCPTITSNLATRPFCSKKPKTMPLNRPRISLSGESVIMGSLVAVDDECRGNGTHHKTAMNIQLDTESCKAPLIPCPLVQPCAKRAPNISTAPPTKAPT